MYRSGDELTWNLPPDLVTDMKVRDASGIQKMLRRVLKHFHKVARPAYAGPISLDTGLSIRQVDLLLQILLDAGDIRVATADEVKRLGGEPSHNPVVYALSAGVDVKLAYD